MALEAGGKKYCKLIHSETGKNLSRRIHSIKVQAADGRLYTLEGDDLPDSISTFAGVSYRGAHMAEVLLSPRDAKAIPILPPASGWLSKRDAFYVVLGFFFLRLINFLAEEVAIALM